MPKPAKDDDPAHTATIPHVQPEPRPDFSSERDPPKPLPASISATLNSDESYWKILTDGNAKDTTETDYRYAAYASRARTILRSAHRYVAYTSDIGESFRPIAHPWLVRSAYGISWAYLIGDVSNEGYKAYVKNQEMLQQQSEQHIGEDQEKSHLHSGSISAASTGDAARTAASGQGVAATAVAASRDLVQKTPATVAPVDDYRTVMAQRAIFQGVASMGLPAFTIHSIVKYGGKALKDVKNTRLRTWGPIGLGLAAVPALPFMFDEPVEHAVDYIFHKGFEMAGHGQPSKEKEL